MANMKYSSAKIMVVAIALIMTLAMATTTAFAWFSMNTEANVDGLNITATTGDGLMISLNGTDWKKNLTNADLEAYFQGVYADMRLTPVYWNGTTFTDGSFKMIDTTLNRNNAATIASYFGDAAVIDQTTGVGQYIALPIQVKTNGLDSGETMEIFMENLNVVSATKTEPFTQVVPQSLNGEDATTYIDTTNDFAYIIDLIATGAIAYTNVDADSNGATSYDADDTYLFVAQMPMLASAANCMRVAVLDDSDTKVFTYQPNSTKGYSVSGTNMAEDYWNARGNYVDGTDWQYMEQATSTNKFYNAACTYDAAYKGSKIITLTANDTAVTFTLYIWLDGSDGDCFDSVMNDTMFISFRLEGGIV